MKTFIERTGNAKSKTRLVWLHGWGQSHEAFTSLNSAFSNYENLLIDLPGFGKSSAPDEPWGTEDYANYIEKLLKKESKKDTYIIGHSLGCRIALRLAHQHPNTAKGLILIAAAGLKRRRSPYFKVRAFTLKTLGKIAGKIDKVFSTQFKEAYSNKFGSADYRKAQGVMRTTFIKTISEDLAEIAPEIRTDTVLIYGENDNETPPYFGIRYKKMMANSKFVELPNFDHYTILSTGRHQVSNIINEFLDEGL